MSCEKSPYLKPDVTPGLDSTPEEVQDGRRNDKLSSIGLQITEACT